MALTLQHPIRRFICIIFYCRPNVEGSSFRIASKLNWIGDETNESSRFRSFWFGRFVYWWHCLRRFVGVHVYDNVASVRPDYKIIIKEKKRFLRRNLHQPAQACAHTFESRFFCLLVWDAIVCKKTYANMQRIKYCQVQHIPQFILTLQHFSAHVLFVNKNFKFSALHRATERERKRD